MVDTKTIREWYREAREAGWTGLADITRAAVRVHGEVAGLWRCEHCHSPVLDPAVGSEAGCDDEIIGELLHGDIVLCSECYDEAVEARKKIRIIESVEDWGVEEIEDDSDLTDDERTLTGCLDKAESALNRKERELIRDYPRGERRQLHRYQDDIEADRRRSGKTHE